MAKVPYWHVCHRLNNGLARHLDGQKAGLPFVVVKMLRTPVNLLGCSLEHFVQHIEWQLHDGMTWGNFKRWHLDHIFPISGVNVYDDTEVFAACNFRNLRPMWAADNLRKHANVTEETLHHFRTLCDIVRQPWRRLRVPHSADAYVEPRHMTAAEIMAMPPGAFAAWVAEQERLAGFPHHGHFVGPGDADD